VADNAGRARLADDKTRRAALAGIRAAWHCGLASQGSGMRGVAPPHLHDHGLDGKRLARLHAARLRVLVVQDGGVGVEGAPHAVAHVVAHYAVLVLVRDGLRSQAGRRGWGGAAGAEKTPARHTHSC
jgi:hypothetical protein